MKDLQEIFKSCLVLVGPAVLFAGVALPAQATSFSSGAYYVGVEDHPVSGQGAGDKDYNDLIFTLSGSGLKLNSNGTLSNPITPNDNGSPFWDYLSGDGAGKTFGNCLYTAATNPCTGGAPIDPSAKYLSNGGSFVGFDFSGASASVTLTIDAALRTDNDTLYWCTDPSHCHVITGGGTFTPGAGMFYFELLDTTGTNHSYTSETSNFAAALNPTQATPEPLSLGLTGGGLLGLFFLRRRRTHSS
jgi:hypothetical protein